MRGVVLIALVGLAGCRFGFEPRRGSDDGGADDAAADDGADGTNDAPITACTSFGPWSAPTALATLNMAGQQEFGPTPSPNGLELVFHSNRLGGAGLSDLYVATRASRGAAYGNVTNISALNTGFNDESATFSLDGLTLFFASDRSGAYRLYRTTRSAVGAAWGAPTIVSEVSATMLQGPALSKQGNELYVSQGATTTLHLLRATYNGSTFSTPTTIAEFNDGMERGYSGLSPDGLMLTYEGQRTTYQVLYVTRPAIGMPWGTESTFSEIDNPNSNADPEWSYDGTELYFSSDRLTPGATYDMFVITRSCL